MVGLSLKFVQKWEGQGFWGDVWGSMDNNCSEVVKITKEKHEGQMVINAASKLMFIKYAYNHAKTRPGILVLPGGIQAVEEK